MNVFSRTAIAITAVLATAVIPATGAMAGTGKPAEYGKHYSYKKAPGYYKKGPRAHYPRGYNKHRPPAVVHKGNSNAAALGLLGFAAGAIVGGAIAGGR
ncbi:hypothetical protein [Hoeflea prorocentri]|uniref:Transmembrane protein n=1 Tax=Hoeflea prorocentri TaxID=1922333 RepID=A0A9X3ZFE5_9HYPH|nr:hypothetical protein [Hoeflea prorocentri]MCY6379572.1 hypothetical protein [Hoeflea prorocentri]MDA5397372.1 hypothetical protein [Hoeflea prorocentri]